MAVVISAHGGLACTVISGLSELTINPEVEPETRRVHPKKKGSYIDSACKRADSARNSSGGTSRILPSRQT